jgi:hypothetical protein
MWDISANDEALFVNGNRATPENDSPRGCEGEFCPDGTCRTCHYSGAAVDY